VVVERLGQLLAVREAGWFIAIPVIDRIRYCIDMRERALDIPAQVHLYSNTYSVYILLPLFFEVSDNKR